jgi:hypothetical protein
MALSLRAVNRATLARQLLLTRAPMTPLAAVTHLAGLQAQAPLAPYVGLWTRLAGFRPGGLAELVETRQAVRMPLMRCTVHLVTADDALSFLPLLRPVHERGLAASPFGRAVAGLDLGELAAASRDVLAAQPLTRKELGAALATRWPGHDPVDLAYAVTYLGSLAQVPPRGVWGRPQGPPRWAAARAWLGRPSAPRLTAEDLIRRYLAAFGPATVADIQAWSGLTRLREVTDAMTARPGDTGLRAEPAEDGASLLDLPGAPRPDPDTPAPVRFLPEYDNLLLSHADRARVIPGRRPVPLPPGNGARTGTVLVDGWWRGTWSIVHQDAVLTLRVEPHAPLARADTEELEAEAARLLAFAAPGTGRDHDQASTRVEITEPR